jgi:hypothetical protein
MGKAQVKWGKRKRRHLSELKYLRKDLYNCGGELLFPVLVKRARLFPQMNPVQRNNFPSIDASRRGKINGGAAIIFS